MTIDYLSLSTTPIYLYKGGEIISREKGDSGKLISQGTGFFFSKDMLPTSPLFLVTNYHVLTGIKPLENGIPKGDNIRFFFHSSKDDLSKHRIIQIPIFSSDGTPIWITNSKCPEADIAIIPILPVLSNKCTVHPLSPETRSDKRKMIIRVGMDAVAIGYPYDYYDKKHNLPIWKTGHIASEPEIDFEGKPLLLLDISAFPGMSGSPVLAQSTGMVETRSGMSPGRARRFIGILASLRRHQKKFFLEELVIEKKEGIKYRESLQIVHIWKVKLILEIIKDFNFLDYKTKFWDRVTFIMTSCGCDTRIPDKNESFSYF